MDKNNNVMVYSDGIRNAAEVNDSAGEVTFYFARFDSVDAYGRRMSEKAFNRTLNNNKDFIYHLLNHNEDTVIGKPIAFGTDSKGAWVTSKLANTEKGKETLELYREGIYKYASFGFYIMNTHEENDVEIVDEAKVIEVSTVLYPANKDATVIAVNKLLKEDISGQALLNKIDEVIKLLTPATEHSDSVETSDLINYINNFK